MYKYLRPVKIRRIGKSLHPMKIKRIEKSLRPMNIRQMVKSSQREKIRRTMESLRALKSPRWWKTSVYRKAGGTGKAGGLLTRSAESPTTDFSLVLLMSTFSSLLMWWISHVVSKWGGSSCCPCFMGRLSPVPYRLFVLARHAKKWLKSKRQQKVWLPPGIPLIPVKTP
jgi:hypothetical protein